MMECRAADRAEVVKVAGRAVLRKKAVPITVSPSLNATFPCGVRVPPTDWTVAVKVIGSPVLAGLLLEVRVVVLGRSPGTRMTVEGLLVASVIVAA
ncbi:hypothetical protein GCM10010151_57190 [Actinoallomurus spadix]|uniref:Uncharacterized protein n=1 Tax=Actinoallomurus spadix TaxID=79912 RepID=A0ABP3H1G6_9ACTN